MKIRLSKYDRMWSKIIHERDGCCAKCGKRPPYVLQAHHIVPRSRKATRLVPDAGILLCAHHHTLGDDSAHRRGKDFVIELLGEKEYKRIEKMSLQHKTERQAIKEFEELMHSLHSVADVV